MPFEIAAAPELRETSVSGLFLQKSRCSSKASDKNPLSLRLQPSGPGIQEAARGLKARFPY